MILFCGLTTIDLAHEVSSLPEKGAKIVAERASKDVGGPATNAARTASALGHPTRLASLLGDGPLAFLARRLLENEGIEIIDLADRGDPAISSIAVTPDGERTVISTNNAGRRAKTPSEDILDDVSVLLIDGHLMKIQTALARSARERGIPVVLDAGSYRDGIRELMATCSHVVASDAFRFPEAPSMSGAELCAEIAGLGAQLAGQTHGPAGIDVLIDGQHEVIPVETASTVVDTLGAGDVMHGALASALADGLEGTDAVEFAARVATRSVQYSGALSWAHPAS